MAWAEKKVRQISMLAFSLTYTSMLISLYVITCSLTCMNLHIYLMTQAYSYEHTHTWKKHTNLFSNTDIVI
jgi:hypothetical protein